MRRTRRVALPSSGAAVVVPNVGGAPSLCCPVSGRRLLAASAEPGPTCCHIVPRALDATTTCALIVTAPRCSLPLPPSSGGARRSGPTATAAGRGSRSCVAHKIVELAKVRAERSGQCVRSCSVAVAGRSCSQSLASAHTAVRLQSQEDKAVWNTREFMWAVRSHREPTTTRTKHDLGQPHSAPNFRLDAGIRCC